MATDNQHTGVHVKSLLFLYMLNKREFFPTKFGKNTPAHKTSQESICWEPGYSTQMDRPKKCNTCFSHANMLNKQTDAGQKTAY
jgi:hypothetical protein